MTGAQPAASPTQTLATLPPTIEQPLLMSLIPSGGATA